MSQKPTHVKKPNRKKVFLNDNYKKLVFYIKNKKSDKNLLESSVFGTENSTLLSID